MQTDYALPAGYRLRKYVLRQLLDWQDVSFLCLAQDQELDVEVVVEELLPEDFAVRARDGGRVIPKSLEHEKVFSAMRELFLKKGRFFSEPRHDSILLVRDVFEENGTAYLVTPSIKGHDLEDWLVRRGITDEAELCAILRPLLAALQVVHEAGFLHRELTPHGILMDARRGLPVVTGFAEAYIHIPPGEKWFGPEATCRTSVGARSYAAFEQFPTRGKVGPWTDLYALGGVLYRAMMGVAPPTAIDRTFEDPPGRIAGFPNVQGYSPAFLDMVEKALQRRPADRWHSAAEWLAALDAHRGAAAPEAGPRGWWLRRAVAAVLGRARMAGK